MQQLDRYRRRQRLLDRSAKGAAGSDAQRRTQALAHMRQLARDQVVQVASRLTGRKLAEQGSVGEVAVVGELDRKSTRLNSSHSQISYAVFCLKKNKDTTTL